VALAALVSVAVAQTAPGSEVETLKGQTTRPNILLVTLDTTRADVLGCYGGDPKVSPNLDRIAGRSHLFERCEASVPQTMPSHTTLFSGLHPFHHGVRKNLAIKVGPEVPLLAEELHGKGYRTAAFVSSFVVDGRFGFERGFDHYDAPDIRPRLGGGMERRAAETVRTAIDWIATSQTPWFVWVHIFDPHAPYEAPPPFSERFADRPYAAEVAYADNEVGRLVGALVARGLFESAVVVIAGDHGEALGEHGEETHGVLLYEATTRVPLLIHMPGQTEAVSHSSPVGLIDIAPTLRDLIGIETPGDGISLLPKLNGNHRAVGERTLYIESLEGYLRNGWAPLFAVVRGPMKYIQSPRPELYDLGADPNERRDLAADRRATVADLDRRLSEIRSADEAFDGEVVVLSSDEEAALLALGYVSGSPGEAAGSRRNPVDAMHLAPIHQQALEAKARGDLESAARLFEQELAEDPSSPVLLWYLGSCVADNDPKRAMEAFRRAIEMRPEFEAAYDALGEVLLQQGDTAAAADVASEGIRQTPDVDGRLHYLRAAASAQIRGRTEEAVRDLGVAIERAARPGPAYRLRAAIRLQLLDDEAGALDDLELFADWSTPEDLSRLENDKRFEALHGNPRFNRLVGIDSGR
jgi:arylsulfatase A-like enzyme/Tfp pilus assembly protein PilF